MSPLKTLSLPSEVLRRLEKVHVGRDEILGLRDGDLHKEERVTRFLHFVTRIYENLVTKITNLVTLQEKMTTSDMCS